MTIDEALRIAALDGDTVSSMELIAAAGLIGRALDRGRAEINREWAEAEMAGHDADAMEAERDALKTDLCTITLAAREDAELKNLAWEENRKIKVENDTLRAALVEKDVVAELEAKQ